MNVGTEAFQDGFWIPGAIGTFSGYFIANPADSTHPLASVPGNAEADLTLGLVGVSEHDQTFNGPVTGRRWKIIRPYVQDDWRITKDLTLNLGLAWDIAPPITEAHGRMADYVPSTGVGQLLVANQNGVGASAGIHTDWTALEPRIGAAWKVLGSDKTVLRAATPFITTPFGARVHKAYGRTRLSLRRAITLVWHKIPESCLRLPRPSGAQPPPRFAPPTAATPLPALLPPKAFRFLRPRQVSRPLPERSLPNPRDFKHGAVPAVQRERGAADPRERRAHGGLRRLARQPHPGRGQCHQHQRTVRLHGRLVHPRLRCWWRSLRFALRRRQRYPGVRRSRQNQI